MALTRLQRHAIRAVIVLSIAIIGISVAVFAATSGEPSKPGPIVHRSEPIAAPDALSGPPDAAGIPTDTVPARAPTPAGVTCPANWSYFDNPVMHYGICVPPEWGFSDFRSANALDRVPAVQLENLHLLGNAFPWHPGALPFDAIKAGSLDVELDVLPAAARSSDECEPTVKQIVGLLTFLSCEQRYDDAGLPSPSGVLRALKVIVPLRTQPGTQPGTQPTDGSGDLVGARLLVIARSSLTASLKEVGTLWQIVRSVRPY